MKYTEKIVKTGINIILVLAVMLFVYALVFSTSGEAYTGSFDKFKFNEGWLCTDMNGGTSVISLPARVHTEAGKTITLHNTLPEDVRTGMSLAYRSSLQNVEIYIDGKLRGSYCDHDFERSVGYLPSSYVFADLLSEDAGKDIDILLTPFFTENTYLNEFEYSYGNNIWFFYINKNIPNVFLSVSLILIGLIAMLAFAFLHRKVSAGKSFFYLAQFIIVFSLWILSESRIRQLLFASPRYSAVFAFIFIEIIAAYALLFIDELQGRYYHRLYVILETAIFLQILLNTALNFTGLVSYYYTLTISHIWTFLSVIAVLATIAADIRSKRIKKYSTAAFGLVGVAAGAVFELINFYIKDRSLIGLPMGIGLVLLLGTTLTQTIEDIIELKHEKDVNESNAKIANEANRAKSDFLAQMSHEIRTPINAVLGMNEMILRECSDPDALEYAGNAYNAGKALLSIINDILDISKIEAGRLEITENDYDLYSLISDCYNMTADRAEKKGLAFDYKVDEDLPTKLCGDMFHIRQITVNFITNAIKYTDEGSVELLISGEKREDKFFLKISVRDTGIGLSEESMQHLFERFQRFDMKHNQSIEGTGLGLSICKQLAELMGGEVSAESSYGHGSVFTCTIPQKISDASPVGNVVIDHASGIKLDKNKSGFTVSDARILVVDDVEMNLVVFRSLLKGRGLTIDEAQSGKDALALIGKNRYDIIFMDHMMPEMDGMETLAEMKRTEHPNSDTPVVMLTANALSGEKEKYIAAGFASYMTKPIQSEKLNETLLSFLPGEKIVWHAEDEDTSDMTASDANTSDENSEGPIDKRLGLSYTGSEEAYLTILSSYVKGGEEQASAIKNALEKEEWKNYVTYVHALKSTSLTIGAKQLSEDAKELEALGKAGEYEAVRQKTAPLLELYKSVLKCGGDMLSSGGREETKTVPEALSDIDRDKLIEYIERIINAVQSFDSDEAAAVCGELSAYSFGGEPLSEQLAEIKEAAEDFDYEKAENSAKEFSEKIIKS